jgi:hypothetical protein
MAAAAAWILLYSQLASFSEWAVSLLPVERHGPLGEASAFFLYDVPKVLLLLAGVIFVMGVIRSFFSPERTRAPSSPVVTRASGTLRPPAWALSRRSAHARPYRCSLASYRQACRSASPSHSSLPRRW